jgi:hypothetical protein
MINMVSVPKDRIKDVKGKGYKDSQIINTSVIRYYNTHTILEIIKKNKGVKLYTTFGKGSALKEWQKEIDKLGSVIPLVSPSLAARVPKGSNKFNYMLSDWKSKIKHKCNSVYLIEF